MKCQCPHCGGNLEVTVQAELSPFYNVSPIARVIPIVANDYLIQKHLMQGQYDYSQFFPEHKTQVPNENEQIAQAKTQSRPFEQGKGTVYWDNLPTEYEAERRVWLPKPGGSEEAPPTT